MICCSCGKEIDINYGREYWNGIYCKKCADEMLSTPEDTKKYEKIIAGLQAENAALRERLEKAVELPCAKVVKTKEWIDRVEVGDIIWEWAVIYIDRQGEFVVEPCRSKIAAETRLRELQGENQ